MRGKQHLRGRQSSPRRLFAVCLVLAASLSLLGLFISRTVRISSLRAELDRILLAQERASAEQDALRARLLTINDAEVIETAARSLLGLVYPGEEKVIFVDEE